jgi:hypothetical protein
MRRSFSTLYALRSTLLPLRPLRHLCGLLCNSSQNKLSTCVYTIDIQSHEFPLLEKEGWPGMLISGDFER